MTTDNKKKEVGNEGPAIDAAALDSAAELAQCRAERDEYLEGWKRAKADLTNSKREESERLERFVKFAAEDLVRDLMPVMDSFDLGVQAVQGDAAAIKGMTLIRTQFEAALARRGLARITAAPGTPFDPTLHEALGEMPGQGPPGTVAREVSPGFLFHGKVIRPARVMLVGEQASNEPRNADN